MGCLILPQNGVVEGAMHYGSGNSLPQIAVGSMIDSRGGNVGAGDAPKRPKNLQVSATKAYAAKSCREDGGGGGDVGGGSLPSTPESDGEHDVSGCPAADEALDSFTRELISQFLRDYVARTDPRWTDSKALSTMKRVVDRLVEKHRYAYNGMMNRLSLDNRRDDVTFVGAVARSLFGDGNTNWGRVSSLVAFGAVVSQHLKETGRGNCVELVGQEISTYLLTDQRDWLVKNNSWEGFVEFFRVADPETTMRNTLIGLAGFAGVGATLALLIRDTCSSLQSDLQPTRHIPKIFSLQNRRIL
uniref:MCL1 apoptosis regulator, BCL2 family member b n=1 Tax=Scophthalmus maximus TaxID=52904 RepID=A0A8D3B2J3_SCOMX